MTQMQYNYQEQGYVGEAIIVDGDSFSEAKTDYLKDHSDASENEAEDYLLEELHWDEDMEGVRVK